MGLSFYCLSCSFWFTRFRACCAFSLHTHTFTFGLLLLCNCDFNVFSSTHSLTHSLSFTLLSFYDSASGWQFLLFANAWHSISFRHFWCFCLQWQDQRQRQKRRTILCRKRKTATIQDEKHASAKQLLVTLAYFILSHWSQKPVSNLVLSSERA